MSHKSRIGQGGSGHLLCEIGQNARFTQVQPPRRVKILLPAFCIDMRVDYRGAASSWRVAPLESLGDVYDGIGRALRLPQVRFI